MLRKAYLIFVALLVLVNVTVALIYGISKDYTQAIYHLAWAMVIMMTTYLSGGGYR